MAQVPIPPEGAEQWFATLPGWMQLAASVGVGIVAIAAGAYGFITKLRPGQAGVTQDAPLVIEGAGLLGSSETAKAIHNSIKELVTVQTEIKLLLIRVAQAVEASHKLAQDEKDKEEFDKAVFEKAKQMLEERGNRRPRTKASGPID